MAVQKKGYGPHLFPKNGDGAEEFRMYLEKKFPILWEKTFQAPLLDKEGVLLWAPKKTKENIL